MQKDVCSLILRLLCNMYTQSTNEGEMNDTCSDSFPLLNGVKHGAVLSPILFTIDGLWEGLKLSGIGCHVGCT